MQLSTPRAHLSSNRGGRGRSKPAVAAAESASSSPSKSSPTSTSRPRPQLRSPPLPPPGWDAQVSLIDSKPLSKLVLALFRSKMALALEGKDSDEPKGSYEAIVDLTKKLNALPPSETTAKTRNILKSLFPSWLPGAFAVLFSKPLPYISARINAEATALACEWLMGPTEVNDGGGRGETRGDVLDGSSSLASTSSPPLLLLLWRAPDTARAAKSPTVVIWLRRIASRPASTRASFRRRNSSKKIWDCRCG